MTSKPRREGSSHGSRKTKDAIRLPAQLVPVQLQNLSDPIAEASRKSMLHIKTFEKGPCEYSDHAIWGEYHPSTQWTQTSLSSGLGAFNLGRALLFCAIGSRVSTTALHVVVIHAESLVDLGTKGSIVIDPRG
jgi:hypothetical protein